MLPKPIQERLATEFQIARDAILISPDLQGKFYFLSVFYGEAGRQLNNHWDADLNLMREVVQQACQFFAQKPQLVATPLLPQGGIPQGFPAAIDEVSSELCACYQEEEVDLARLYTALSRVAELTYALTGNGVYLYLKGMIKIDPSGQPPPVALSLDAAQETTSPPDSSPPSPRRASRGRPRRRS